ncbi:hypothetical protein [Escherichia coli]|uniref:hypothetical protein n=1 Tax=Escherichia coli TaxID=562 RepID=UPI003986C0DD
MSMASIVLIRTGPDELTAILYSLEEPVQKAAKMSGVDEIDGFFLFPRAGGAKPVRVQADKHQAGRHGFPSGCRSGRA